MRITRRSTAVAATLLLLAVTHPAQAVTTVEVGGGGLLSPSLVPVAGSTDVVLSDGSLRLDGPASRGSIGVEQRFGYANLESVRFDASTSGVVVAYAAKEPGRSTAAVDVRAQRSDGVWTEWTPAADGEVTALAAPSRIVQLRVVMSEPPGAPGPAVSDVTIEPARAARADRPAFAADPLTYTVYATREGLVGGTTANGHVITERDHFVSFPTRRSLSDEYTGTYSVKVCTDSRCAFEPVWEVGPWNVTDDYWSPPDVRESWQDLPQGLPEAQAAYEDGYNGGQDGRGRDVLNPAGIDLADGTFWDGLGLSDNAWVDVTYLWTGDGARGTVELDSGTLNVRAGTDSQAEIVGLAGNYAQVPAGCQAVGEEVTGSQGTTNLWIQVHPGMYVSKAYLSGLGDLPAC